jgi:death-on-curing protein
VSVEFVRADVIKNVHQRLIEHYGGLPGIRDENAFESALARPKSLVADVSEESIGALGAVLAWGTVRNHPFADGNKRAAFAALAIFLEINGHQLTCSEVEETAMMLCAAASEITEDEFTAWVERSVAML